MDTLTVGTRIYNGGDMANPSEFGTIIEVRSTDYLIQPDPGSDRRKPYPVFRCAFRDEYLGHGGTRFVTEAEYRRWHAAALARIQAKVLVTP